MISLYLLTQGKFPPGELPPNSFSKYQTKEKSAVLSYGKKVMLYGRICCNIKNGCNTRYEIKIGAKQKVRTL